jgi:phenylalanyl-tRNA synthetase beta chain
MDIPDQTQQEMLRRLGFGIKELDGRQALVTVPSYRVDILAEIDLIEEIARLNDYNNIPAEAHASVTFDLEVHPLLKLMEDTRGFFIDSGFMETTGFYMTDPEAAAAYGTPVELRNALGRDSSMLRTSLVPGMARATALNERYGRRDLRLFEVGKAFRKGRPDQGTIPGIVEVQELAVLMSGAAEPVAWDVPARNSDMQDLRGMLDRYFARIRAVDIVYSPVAESRWGIDAPALAVFAGGEEIGRLGRVDPWALERYDVAGKPVVALLDIERLARHAYRPARYAPPSKFPVVERDISLQVDAGVSHALLESTIRASGEPLLSGVRLFDLYQGKGVEPGKKSVAYALRFTSYDRTLDESTIEEKMTAIIQRLESEHGAKLRGG